MIDLNNPDKAGPYDPAACWKRALIKHLARMFNLPTFIETGTCYGDTIDDVKDSFSDVWSIELNSSLYEHSIKRFYRDLTVHIIWGSSGEMLPFIIKDTKGPRLFWLDAHSTGSLPGNGGQVNLELDAIYPFRDSLVLIDDVVPGDNMNFFAANEEIDATNWTNRFLHGVLILHDGRYPIPEVF